MNGVDLPFSQTHEWPNCCPFCQCFGVMAQFSPPQSTAQLVLYFPTFGEGFFFPFGPKPDIAKNNRSR